MNPELMTAFALFVWLVALMAVNAIVSLRRMPLPDWATEGATRDH